MGRTAIGGFLVCVALAVIGWQALSIYSGVPGRDYSTFYVSTPQVGNLLSHDPVRIAGARIGQVLDRDVGPDGDPRIELQIEPGVDIPADTAVAVRGAGLLGARYIELVPGTSAEQLAEGATIAGTDASYTFGLTEALDTFDGETRGALGETIRGLGEGLFGHGEALNDGIRAAGTRSKPFGEFAAAVLERDGAARRLVPALESATTPLDRDREALTDLSPGTVDALEPFVATRDELRETLDVAAPSLTTMRAGLASGTRLVSRLRGAAGEASRTLAPAPRGLRGLTALLRESDEPLRRAASLLEAAGPAVPAALRVTSALRPVLEPAREMLEELSPTFREVARYECDIVNFGLTMRSMTGYKQPGEGPLGPTQAFRLQIVLPLSGDVVGVRDDSGFNKREQVVEPCTYLAKPYPRFVPGGSG